MTSRIAASPSRGGRKAQKNRTREELIRAAARVMAKNGLLAARTAEIADAAGVAHGTLFAHFPTRDSLLRGVIEDFGFQVAAKIHAHAESGSSVREILLAHIEGLAEFELLYSRLILEARSIPHESRSSLISIQSAIAFHLGGAIEREIAAGKLRAAPLHLLFNTWVGLVHYYLVNGDLFAPGQSSVLKRYGKTLVDHYCSLISLGA